jgi:hypothetical protein
MQGRKYAEGTTVDVGKTRQDIERLVRKFGAESFTGGWDKGSASVSFTMHGRYVRFRLELPIKERFQGAYEREERRRWRCLLLAIKAKLEVVETGIATFDEEFLAHVVMPDDLTVWERMKLMEGEGRPMLPAVPS